MADFGHGTVLCPVELLPVEGETYVRAASGDVVTALHRVVHGDFEGAGPVGNKKIPVLVFREIQMILFAPFEAHQSLAVADGAASVTHLLFRPVLVIVEAATGSAGSALHREGLAAVGAYARFLVDEALVGVLNGPVM